MFLVHTQLGKTQLLQIANIIYNNWQCLPIALALETLEGKRVTLEGKRVKLSMHNHCATHFMTPFAELNIKDTDAVVYKKFLMNYS